MYYKIVALKKIKLESEKTYLESAAQVIQGELIEFLGPDLSNVTMKDVAKIQDEILIHSHIKNDELIYDLEDKDFVVFDREKMTDVQINKGIKALLEGKIIWEHTAAGAATRLGIGTKYTITPMNILEAIRDGKIIMQGETQNKELEEKRISAQEKQEIIKEIPELYNISLGTRKLAMFAYSIRKEAMRAIDEGIVKLKDGQTKEAYADEVLKKQIHTISLNQDTDEYIINEIKDWNYFGFNPKNLLFMVIYRQPGFIIKDGEVVQDTEKKSELHNHGVARMHTVMDNVFFRIQESGSKLDNKVRRVPLSYEEVRESFKGKVLFVSNNIEDLDQLTSPYDILSIAKGLELGEQGYQMIMTAVGQKTPAQKGGFFAKHKETGVVYCYESDQAPSLKPEDIKHLNKNVNMFYNPLTMLDAVKTKDMALHPTVEKGMIIPKTPQGDVNFFLKTAVIKEKTPVKIRNVKEQVDLVPFVEKLKEMDKDEGFISFVNNLKELHRTRETINEQAKQIGLIQDMINKNRQH